MSQIPWTKCHPDRASFATSGTLPSESCGGSQPPDDHGQKKRVSDRWRGDGSGVDVAPEDRMLHAVMLGSGPGRGRHEWYPGFYLQRRRLGCRMNRGEQETLFRQSRQLTRIVPSHEDLVLSVLKSPISQQQQQRHQHYHHSQEHYVNYQGHHNLKKCRHSGTLVCPLSEERDMGFQAGFQGE